MVRFCVVVGLMVASGFASAAPSSLLVPGSDQRDFGVICRADGKITYAVRKQSADNNFRVARDIYFTDMGGGRVAISLMRGFLAPADIPSTYLTSSGESCETFAQ